MNNWNRKGFLNTSATFVCMYVIKAVPEDFVVKEVSSVKIQESGEFVYFWLKKKNFNTLDALRRIARKTNHSLKDFGFAGNKDKHAITTQLCSAKRCSQEELLNVHEDGIQISIAGRGDMPVSLGQLEGNEFTITVRSLESNPFPSSFVLVNFFGEQRFSDRNHIIGKHIVRREFKQAAEVLLQSQGEFEHAVRKYLEVYSTDAVGALRCIPLKLLRLFVHAFQSQLWNDVALKFVEAHGMIKVDIPLIGFGLDVCDERLQGIINEVLREYALSPRDFVLREFPELSSEGGARQLVVPVVFVENREDVDELNSGKKKVVVSFRLPAGSYATEVIRQVISRERVPVVR